MRAYLGRILLGIVIVATSPLWLTVALFHRIGDKFLELWRSDRRGP